jgi:hypothetical protein
MSKLVIGIDQSYTNSGITVIRDGKITQSFSLERIKAEPRIEYRQRLLVEIFKITNAFEFATQSFHETRGEIFIYTETNNYQQRTAIVSATEIITSLEDLAWDRDYTFKTITATQWQSNIGRHRYPVKMFKDERKPKKMPVIKIIEEEYGIDCKLYKNGEIKKDAKGLIWYNDDKADSVGIALFGWKEINGND